MSMEKPNSKHSEPTKNEKRNERNLGFPEDNNNIQLPFILHVYGGAPIKYKLETYTHNAKDIDDCLVTGSSEHIQVM